MSETLDLPLIIAGRKRYAASGDDVISFRTETGVQVRVPRLTRDDLAVIDSRRETAADRLAKMTVRELVTFLSEAGNRWMDPNSAGRKLVTEHAAKFAQLSPNMIDHDCYLMGAILSGHHFTYDAIASEFGSESFYLLNARMLWLKLGYSLNGVCSLSQRRASPRCHAPRTPGHDSEGGNWFLTSPTPRPSSRHAPSGARKSSRRRRAGSNRA